MFRAAVQIQERQRKSGNTPILTKSWNHVLSVEKNPMFVLQFKFSFVFVPPQPENDIGSNGARPYLFTILGDMTSDSLIDNMISNSIMENYEWNCMLINFMGIQVNIDVMDLLA